MEPECKSSGFYKNKKLYLRLKQGEINMNFIFVQGKIISDINYKFMIEGKDKAVAIFKIKLLNNSELTVKAYNDPADYCYRNLEKEDYVLIEGFLNSNMEIIIKSVEK